MALVYTPVFEQNLFFMNVHYNLTQYMKIFWHSLENAGVRLAFRYKFALSSFKYVVRSFGASTQFFDVCQRTSHTQLVRSVHAIRPVCLYTFYVFVF